MIIKNRLGLLWVIVADKRQRIHFQLLSKVSLFFFLVKSLQKSLLIFFSKCELYNLLNLKKEFKGYLKS